MSEFRGDLEAGARPPFATFVNPDLGELLERLALDKCFVRGEGHRLIDAAGCEYLDAVSGYGAAPFGHHPDFVWQAIHDCEMAREPAMAQPSLLPAAGQLAEELIRIGPPGFRCVTFGNSGTEAVEAAIKACRMATGRLGIVSAVNGFHGKTLGSLSATGRSYFQERSGAPAAGFRTVPFGDLDALDQILAEERQETAAFLVEPIQGEAGVIEPPAGYLRGARRICDRHDVLLIVDEVQTGLGRTGELFACQSEGIAPDAMPLAKALGGGLLPVSACLLGPRAYTKHFALRHSSTFGGNALAMRVGLRVLERLAADDSALLEQVVRRGSFLKRGLEAIRREFPSVIRDVRGRGLMLGVELAEDRAMIERGVGALMAMLGDGLAFFAASYLLNEGRVRVAPTLNGTQVLRVQPPLTVTQDECEWILRAFRDLASVIASGRSDRFFGPGLKPREPPQAAARTISGFYRTTDLTGSAPHPDEPEGRFAFIAHLLDGKSLSDLDRSLGRFSAKELEELTRRFEDSAEPFVASTVRIESAAGRVAVGDFIILPKSTAQLLRMAPEEALEDVAAAVRLGRDRGAKIVGLGGYTSVVATNLRALLKLDVALTTGNSYTVVSAIEAALEAARLTGANLEESRAAVVGGGGSIGSALASLLAERVASLVLVTREGDAAAMRSRYATILARMVRHLRRRALEGAEFRGGSLAHELGRLECGAELPERGRIRLDPSLEERLLRQARELPVRWTTELAATVASSDLVFLATSTPGELLRSEMVQPGTVLCDLSRPANVGEDLHRREDVLVIDGGIVEVPGRPSLGFHFSLATGFAYACMAETMMLALERRYEHTSLGRDLEEGTLDLLRGFATKHGFRLAELRARQRPLDLAPWRSRFPGIASPLRRVAT
jgi:acetylornithine/succinyldiaminopimelate/putrescine aminotransferase/predicted amino acid dehydrogenase